MHAIGITTNNQRSKAINDVGFDLLPGNYEVFLTQIEPNATSQGWWNIGPVDQPYGRFARSFDTAAGKNTMYFALNKDFFVQNASRSMKVRVVYLDQGKGSWSLCYIDNKGKVKTASSVTNTDSGDWKEITTIIGDAAFAGNGPKGADLMLHNDSGDDSVFHMVELMRL